MSPVVNAITPYLPHQRLLGHPNVEFLCLRRVICVEIALATVINTTSRWEAEPGIEISK